MSGNSTLENSYGGQTTRTVFAMSQLEIPSYAPGTGSNNNSTHTTPLNYMRRGTPLPALRRIEQISERDPQTGLDEDSERDLHEKFDVMKLASAPSDDFFQLQGTFGCDLQELEPAVIGIPRVASRIADNYGQDDLQLRYGSGSRSRPEDIDSPVRGLRCSTFCCVLILIRRSCRETLYLTFTSTIRLGVHSTSSLRPARRDNYHQWPLRAGLTGPTSSCHPQGPATTTTRTTCRACTDRRMRSARRREPASPPRRYGMPEAAEVAACPRNSIPRAEGPLLPRPCWLPTPRPPRSPSCPPSS
jgi:hypothetical protein